MARCGRASAARRGGTCGGTARAVPRHHGDGARTAAPGGDGVPAPAGRGRPVRRGPGEYLMTHATNERATVPSGRRPAGRGPREWARAFTGFYPPLAEDLVDLDPIAKFLYSARSVILVISFQAAVIAGLLALADRRFEALPFALVLVGYVVLHAISNLSNDYFGAKRGHDTDDSPLLARGLVILVAIAVAIGVYFIMLRGTTAIWLTVVGALLLWAYDAAPRALKELGLGEIAAFVVWGPLMVAGGYYVITGHYSRAAMLAAVPYGLGVMSILVGKHIDQRMFDEGKHQR